MSDFLQIALFALVGLALVGSVATYFAIKFVAYRVEQSEQLVMRRLAQLHAMQYSMLRQQGWTHEDLKETLVAER